MRTHDASGRRACRTPRAAAFAALAVLSAARGAVAQAPAPPTVWPDEGPATWAPRRTVPAIEANDLRTHLYQLAADSMRGRQAATRGNWMATAYVAAVFRRLGLEPGGDAAGYFQNITYGLLAFDRAAVRLSVDGRALRPGEDWAPVPPQTASAITGDVTARDVPVVFGGSWGDGSTQLPAGMVRGKVVVFLAPPDEPAGGRGGAFRIEDTRAQDGGAVAVLLVSDALSESTSAAAFSGRMGLYTPSPPGTAGAELTARAAASLFDQPIPELRVGAAGHAVTASWTYEYHEPEFQARNVIAVLRGSDPTLRDQYVLVGAHNDHVGMVRGAPVDHDSLRAFNTVMRPQGANDRPGAPTRAQQARIDALIAHARSIRPPRADSVMNGADDDGSGTAVLLEIAERFATAPPPKRSIVFISHTAEEAGLLGSRYFTEHPTIPLESIVAAHNMDMLGKGRVTDVRFGGPAQVQTLGARRLSSEFGDVIDSLNAVREETMAIDYSWDRTNALNRFCRSDQVNYFRHTIPVTYFSTGYARDYHQATDEPRYVDFEHSARVGRFVYDIMRTIADRPTRLRVLPLEERDLSAQCTR